MAPTWRQTGYNNNENYEKRNYPAVLELGRNWIITAGVTYITFSNFGNSIRNFFNFLTYCHNCVTCMCNIRHLCVCGMFLDKYVRMGSVE